MDSLRQPLRLLLRLVVHFAPLVVVESAMGPMMGIAGTCDDGNSNLQTDWHVDNFREYTCEQDFFFPVKNNVEEIHYVIPNFNPRLDVVSHVCMNETIQYNDTIPLRGNHRPIWAQYGEYLFVPVQRWMHNLEHGSIILLYHPCADEFEVAKLRRLVTTCLFRHIITPYRYLSRDRPLALVAWGARLEMSTVNETSVVNFIRQHARIAPEDISRQGGYEKFLIKAAEIVSNQDDDKLCPQHATAETSGTTISG